MPIHKGLTALQTGRLEQLREFLVRGEEPPRYLSEADQKTRKVYRVWQMVNSARSDFKRGKLREDLRVALESMGVNLDLSQSGGAWFTPDAMTKARRSPPPAVETLEQLQNGGFRFPVIYADPPWRYGNQATRGATDNHYVTMSLEDIAAMPIKQIAADDAWLFLWTTHNFLFDSQKVLDGWGFTYKSQIIWNKRDPNGFKPSRMGMGNYARMCHEILIIASRGKPQGFTRRNVRSVIDALPSKHSAKPEIFRQIVESVTEGLSPRLELFGRRTAPGWTVFGNEVERDMFAADERRMPAVSAGSSANAQTMPIFEQESGFC
ncbi:MAG: MT-A70 family methyltransferase [Acidithiobacillus sp.]